MKLVVGLGNPGKQYVGTRHNIGFDVLAELARRFIAPLNKQKFEALCSEFLLQNEKVLLVAPQTYMNLSGQSVQKFCSFYHIEPADVLVTCDDLNLPLGKLRIRQSGSAGGQKGLQNIIQQLGTLDVPRLRIGVDPPPAGRDAKDWVLGTFGKSEVPLVETAVQTAAQAIETWIQQGLATAMNRFNGEPLK
jgi:PTH1 family peptidyl-tRNA hydrolase